MRLYCYPESPWSRKVLVALAEKGLACEQRVLDLPRGEHREPWFLALNPRGLVPLLDDDGLIVPESTVINEYLEDRFPDQPLLPRDPAGRARARALEELCDHRLCGPCFEAVVAIFASPSDAARVAELKEQVRAYMDVLERELAGREYLAGAFSLADCAFMPFIQSFDWAELPWDPARHANALAYIARLQERPSWAVGREPPPAPPPAQ